jgi:hypothetical protein
VTLTQFRSTHSVATTTRCIIFSSILAATAIVLYGEELATYTVPTHAVIWGSLALAAYVASLLFLLGARQGELLGLARWSIGSWMLLWYGLTFGLATMIWSGPQPSPGNQIAVSSVLRALWLVAVGITFWAIGYCVGPSHPVRRLAIQGVTALSKKRTMAVRNKHTPWVIYGIGLAARLLTVLTTGRFGQLGNSASAFSTATGYQQILTDLSLFCPLAICAAALQLYRERVPGARITLIILFVVELAFGAAAAGKQGFVVAVLAVAIPMSATRHRLPKALVIGGIIAFMVAIIPFNQEYRASLQVDSRSLSTSQAIEQAPTILRQAITGQDLLGTIGTSTVYLLGRVQEISGPAIILQRTPEQIPFDSPIQLIETPLTYMVPRALWPGKPILQTAYEFSQQYYNIPSTTVTNAAISPIGDLYRHGGWIPLAVGMFLFGCGVRLLDDVLNIHVNTHAILLIILLLPNIVKGEDDWVGLVAGLPVTICFWVFATYLIFRPKSPG